MSDGLDITTGVRQGDVLSPVLFNLYFNVVIAASMSTHPNAGVKMLYSMEGALVRRRRKMRGQVSFRNLEYADDMALVSDTMDALEDTSRVLNGLCVGIGLKINAKKTKVLAVCPHCAQSAPPRSMQLGDGGEHMEVAEEFEYCGSTISQDYTLDHEIDRQISKVSQTFAASTNCCGAERD